MSSPPAAPQATTSKRPGLGLSTGSRGLLIVAVAAAAFLVLVAAKGYQPAAQATVNGLVAGTYFALGAVGLALVYGVLRLVNFAHGDYLTFGAYMALLANAFLGLPIVAATAIAIAATALMAAALELWLWRPMRARRAGGLQLLLIAIGLAFVIRNGIQFVAGSQPRGLNVDVTSAVSFLGGVRLGTTELAVVLIGLVVLVLVAVLLNVSRLGREMRALADNLNLAEVAGVDTGRVIVATWLVAGGLAGLAGVLVAAAVGVLTPNFGFQLLLSLFAATVLGGIGNAYGALAGGLLLGLTQEWSTLFIDARWKLAVGFAILILTLLVRPNGLLGRPALK
ncbi:branched-chain amino acid ABC transporter permease [bacterium]|nr:MAG: branched-chain amino acid ABC transporter permease [bacterium]